MSSNAIRRSTWAVIAFAGLFAPQWSAAAERVLDAKMHPLQLGAAAEWSDSPQPAEGKQLRWTFNRTAGYTPQMLHWRQSGIKHRNWQLRLNNRELTKLVDDPLPTWTCATIPAETLRDGENELVLTAVGEGIDDIQFGAVTLDDRPRDAILHETTLRVKVVDTRDNKSLPARITVVDDRQMLATLGAASTLNLAVRPGVVYTLDGQAAFGLRAGKYTIFAGHGPEYGIVSRQVDLSAGMDQDVTLAIGREVTLPGYVSCDPHVHTWTYSRHGDCTLEERLVTLAAEGITLPIVTDHNLQIDYRVATGNSPAFRYFTPVVGNEVTTRYGHFNLFPLDPAAAVPDHKGEDWQSIFAAIGAPSTERIVILNHPRDLHSNFRPFDPRRHLACAGEDLEGWQLRVNAMELVNSGTLQSDPWRLIHDWFGLLNAGHRLAPIGSSDSHDVSRFIVGQGRTYIRCDDQNARAISIPAAIKNLAEGRAIAGFGILADLQVDDRYGPGETMTAAEQLRVRVRVLGPSWSHPQAVSLHTNGIEVFRAHVPNDARPNAAGVWFEQMVDLPRPSHDAHLVAVAEGEGIEDLFWPTPRPYQPTSPEWKPYSLSITGAIWIDADDRLGFQHAADYARQLVDSAAGDMSKLGASLDKYDAAVGIQVAALLRRQGVLFAGNNLQTLLTKAGKEASAGISQYVTEWKAHEAAISAK